jgi:methylmalonyl-CoA/ethylmalonyl-CoA epimerase
MAKLRHIALNVPDPEAAADFYMKAFGLERVGQTDWANAKGVYLTDGVVNLALLHYKTEEAAGSRGTQFFGIHHLGFWVDNLKQTKDAIEKSGGTYWMGEESTEGGFYEVKYHDPIGVVVDITENGWGGATKDVMPVK